MTMKKMVALASAGVAALSLMGCVKPIRACQCTINGGSYAPSSGMATVILMHPGKTAGSINILDDRGTPITALDRNESWAVSVSPGTTRFYANMGGANFAKEPGMNDAVEITVQPGRTYYVTATTTPQVALRVLTPGARENRWEHRKEWVGGSKAVQIDGHDPKVGTYFGDTGKIIATATKRFDKYDAAHRSEHVATGNDAD